MSEATETLIVCPQEEAELVDTFAIAVGVLTVLGSIIAFFVQQARDRKDEAEARLKEEEDRDREQALERVREQLSVLIGPLHRLWKTQTTINMAYRHTLDYEFQDYKRAVMEKGRAMWMLNFDHYFLQPFIEDPYSYDAVMYRNFVSRRLKPIWTRIRELVLMHMSDLADMPTQEEWLKRFTQEDLKSPHTGSFHINVIYDSYSAWTYEFDDIVESWAGEDFRRMQPITKVPWLICNSLIDLLYENAKEKEARYNKHVSVHKNLLNLSMEDQVRVGMQKSAMDKAKEAIEDQMYKAKDAIENQIGKAKDAIEEQLGKAKGSSEEPVDKERGEA